LLLGSVEQSQVEVLIFLIIDDPHSEQDAMNMGALERAYEWYTSGPRQRLQPGGKIVCVMTRWNVKDLTGILLKEPNRTQIGSMGVGRVSGNNAEW